ncbi:MAG TPA: TonB-dependent receptor, partial [Acidobacteriota bacterium]|nr:TonB-dependent receptor [Acidobacteriota bacterium]
WAISSRGLNLTTSNKLQILMDGRVLYTPLFSGIFWDVQDTILQDLERIEVISGPGATLWGANAINGVINIISRSAKDTQGAFVQAGLGNEERGFAAARYGGKHGDSTYYRGYFKIFSRDGLLFANGDDARDDWLMGRGGFRIDLLSSATDDFTIQGDAYRGSLGLADRDDSMVSGGNILGRWTRNFSDRSSLQLQMYFDRSDRKVPLQFQEKRNTFDVDLNYRMQLFSIHDLIWGLNYRLSADQTENIGTAQFVPQDRNIHLLSAFIQDEITIEPNKLGVILGSKFEQNSYTSVEVQPSVRVAYSPIRDHTLWAAVSRAVRFPTRIDTDFRFFPLPGALALAGNPDFEPEELVAYEGGYRFRPLDEGFIDLSGFYHSYDSLITVEPPQFPGGPAVIGNGYMADLYGATVTSQFQLEKWLRMVGSITFLHKDLELKPGSRDISNAAGQGNDPGHFWSLHSMLDPASNLQLDFIFRSSGELPFPEVPGYVTFDFRSAWQINEQIELSFTGQNLFEKAHPEFGAPSPTRREIERSWYGQITWVL